MYENKISKYILLTVIAIAFGIIITLSYKLVKGISSTIEYNNRYSNSIITKMYVGEYKNSNNKIVINDNNTFSIISNNNEFKGVYSLNNSELILTTYDKKYTFILTLNSYSISGLEIDNINKNDIFIR